MEIIAQKLSYVYMAGTPFAHPALHDVSIHIPTGTFAAILGPTGSGKSTLSQLIAGLITPTSGTIQVGDYQVTNQSKRLDAVRNEVGIVFQYPEYQLFAETVAKDIAFGPTNQGVHPSEVEKRVNDAMQLVGLPREIADKSPFMLSGGQMRKVAIAGVLAMSPSILILDEPTVGLDPQSRLDFLELVAFIQQKKHITVLMVTHQMDEAAAYATYVYLMDQGRCVAEGKPTEIFTNESLLTSLNLDLPEIVKLIRQINQGLTSPLPDHIFTLRSLVTALNDQKDKGKLGK